MPFPDPEGTTINGPSLTAVAMNPNPYPGTPYAFGAEASLGTGTYSRIIWLPPAVVVDGGKTSVTAAVRSIGNDGNAANASVATVDGVVTIELLEASPYGAAMFLGTGDSGDVLKGQSVKIAGSVIVAGNDKSKFKLGNRSSIVNNYDGITDSSTGLGSLAAKLPALDEVDYNGESVQTLDAVVRVQEAKITMPGNASMGEPDVAGDADKEPLDAIYVDDLPNNGDLYADTIGPLDVENLSFPSLSAPFTDPVSGGEYVSFKDYLDTVAYTPPISGDLIIEGATGSFSYSDPGGKGSISWDNDTEVLTIDGVVKINGQAKLADGGEIDSEEQVSKIMYKGTGVIWATDKIEIRKDIYPLGQYLEDGPDADGLVDGNLGLITSTEFAIQSSDGTISTMRIIAALFAEQKILVKEPANIAGSVITDYFETTGNDEVNVWQVPKLSSLAAAGLPSTQVANIRASITDWFQRR